MAVTDRLTSASSLHCGSEGNSSFTSSMVPARGLVGGVGWEWELPAGPTLGLAVAVKGRREGRPED